MNTRDFTAPMVTLMTELVHGAAADGSYMLNLGDTGLLGSLAALSADAASHGADGGASIAAHVDHLRYGFALLNRWAAGETEPWKQADWTESWRIRTVDDATWRALVSDLRREADAWIDALRTPRDVSDRALNWMLGSIAHLAYHLGAIRQIDRASRGPTAEDEMRHKRQ